MSIDGLLTEPAWSQADVATRFIAQQPTEGAVPAEPTEVRVLYDDEALYVGAWLRESDPSNIRSQLLRRDQDGQYDYFAVLIDSNHDRRTGFHFQVNPHGVQSDRLLFDDVQEDTSWDAVWESATFRGEDGWTVEMRIPFSRLQYDPSENAQTWGINFFRRRVVSNEVLHFSLVSRLQRGLVSQFGELTDLRVTETPEKIELMPYVSSTMRLYPAQSGNPLLDHRDSSLGLGGDLTWRVRGNFTLNATFNPDFGQVESDPAVINLTAFETFFPERRPFFVENRQLFEFPLSGGNRLFFSRRIGLSPRGGAPEGSDFSEVPSSTRILGAAKLTGRTSSGVSAGVLASITREETGQAYSAEDGGIEEFIAEPRTHWGALGVQREFREGNSQVGTLFVAMNRNLVEGAAYGPLPGSAFGAGVSFLHLWGDREWLVSGFFAASHVRGSEDAILRVQSDPNHYFQRPDARWVGLDPTATSLSGIEWRVRAGRQRGDSWTGEAWVGQVHPGVAVNDFGFSRDPESVNLGTRINYQEIVPGSVFRSYDFSLFMTGDWSHDLFDNIREARRWRDSTIQGRFTFGGNLQFLNFWRLSPSVGYYTDEYSRTITRGGPVMRVPSRIEGQVGLATDGRRSVSLQPTASYVRHREEAGHRWSVSMPVQLRPRPNLQLQLVPRFEERRDNAQFVAATDAVRFEPTYGSRYLFADVDRRELSLEIRADLAFSPGLTLQMFAQPLIASAEFLSYKQLGEPGTFRFDTFPEGTVIRIGEVVRCDGGRTCEDEDHIRYMHFQGTDAVNYSMRDQDFNVRSLIMNTVIRWEFRNGSALFLVWQRFQNDRAPIGTFSVRSDLGELFAAPPENVFGVKVNYRFGL